MTIDENIGTQMSDRGPMIPIDTLDLSPMKGKSLLVKNENEMPLPTMGKSPSRFGMITPPPRSPDVFFVKGPMGKGL